MSPEYTFIMKTKYKSQTANDAIADMVEAKAVMAPMAGVTDIPFRLMVRKFGCKFAFTEMLDVNGIVYNSPKSFKIMDRIPGDEPLGIQIAGEDEEKISYVGKICEEKGFNVLEINAGCPARKVVKVGKGAALLKDPRKLAGIVRRLKRELTIPVTVKIRSGWNEDDQNCVNVVKAVEAEGADAICIHPRTKEQMYKGKPGHEITRDIKNAVKIPVFASGNLFKPDDVSRVMEMTGCDGVYIARGALGRPWIFREIYSHLEGKDNEPEPSFEELKGIIIEHFLLCLNYYDEAHAIKRMYKYLAWYLKKLKNLNQVMEEYRKVADRKSFCDLVNRLCLEDRRRVYLG